eukprot:TRINITY_DN836_c2_g1_i1.p1 TRINITY_DN836_c2_g1~~TRINITY_DN836_c2_g1_i1.p1  ORF type:complete len:278 (-),score=70.94 TRINITY_DN836_c2_g1_i1:877-1710(-)
MCLCSGDVLLERFSILNAEQQQQDQSAGHHHLLTSQYALNCTHPLSQGVIRQLHELAAQRHSHRSASSIAYAVLQVLNISRADDIYALVLSDGAWYCNGLLAQHLCAFVEDGLMTKGAIVFCEDLDVQCDSDGKVWGLITSMSVWHQVWPLVGIPSPFASAIDAPVVSLQHIQQQLLPMHQPTTTTTTTLQHQSVLGVVNGSLALVRHDDEQQQHLVVDHMQQMSILSDGQDSQDSQDDQQRYFNQQPMQQRHEMVSMDFMSRLGHLTLRSDDNMNS